MVFIWHFTHGRHGYPSPLEGAPIWGPLVLLDEGHVGVALFMTLSGYLFAKLLDGKRVKYRFFLLNRFLRLFPLLAVVIVINAVIKSAEHGSIRAGYWFLLEIPRGLIYPTWPNGGWSIAVEIHFYLILPLLLCLRRANPIHLGCLILLALAYRSYFFLTHGEVQSIAFWTILGRIDQFILGILFYSYRVYFSRNTVLILSIAAIFISIYYLFDRGGGFYQLDGYPSHSPIWVVLTLFEGVALGAFVAWYDTSFAHPIGPVSSFFSKIGEYSYSIYLLHFFFVFKMVAFIDEHILSLHNFYVAVAVSMLAFLAMFPIGFISMKFIESPFLRLRRPYYTQ